jgi:hypothetical protein
MALMKYQEINNNNKNINESEERNISGYHRSCNEIINNERKAYRNNNNGEIIMGMAWHRMAKA